MTDYRTYPGYQRRTAEYGILKIRNYWYVVRNGEIVVKSRVKLDAINYIDRGGVHVPREVGRKSAPTQLLTLPSSTAKGGYDINSIAVREAMDLLEIAQPVEIKLSAGVQKSGGHRYRKPGYHTITISTYLSPREADSTLWHELQHCSQSEHVPVSSTGDSDADIDRVEAWWAYAKANRARYGYWNSPHEVEARATAEAMSADYPLTRRVR